LPAAWETPLGSADKVPTQLFNGYAEFVAGLYVGVENETLFCVMAVPDKGDDHSFRHVVL
jgi:hypothetical protein